MCALYYLFIYLSYFTILYWFCHTLTWIHHECTWAPNPEHHSHLPHHIISLDHPRAPSPSILYSVSNIDWRFTSYMIVYMFQCHSPKWSHPLPLPQSPKVLSIHLCLFCCLAYPFYTNLKRTVLVMTQRPSLWNKPLTALHSEKARNRQKQKNAEDSRTALG